MSRLLLLGHRGARGVRSIPENTMTSFDRALADGCDGFEFDVRLTADGEAVVCHDPKSGRREIARSTASELVNLPRLPDVLARYANAFLDIELKVAGLERIVADTLKKHQPHHFVVSSFLPEVLSEVHKEDSAIPLGLICETWMQLRNWRELPVEYVAPHLKIVRQDLIHELRAAGKKVLVWTVNAAADMLRFADGGVDGMISDYPKRLSQTLMTSRRP